MRLKIICMFLATALMSSCSSDDDNSSEAEPANIVGVWQATELVLDEDTATDEARNARDLLNFLTAKECFVITFTFNENLSVVSENSISFISPTTNEDGTTDIPCPTEEDSDNGTYTYDGTTLVITDSSGVSTSLMVTVQGDVLTVDASGLDLPDFDVTGQLIFQRR